VALGSEAGVLGPLWASGLLVAVALLIAFPCLTVVTADLPETAEASR
jgi:DHA1 family chloramphenicol resistance protein-like MFS transporter